MFRNQFTRMEKELLSNLVNVDSFANTGSRYHERCSVLMCCRDFPVNSVSHSGPIVSIFCPVCSDLRIYMFLLSANPMKIAKSTKHLSVSQFSLTSLPCLQHPFYFYQRWKSSKMNHKYLFSFLPKQSLHDLLQDAVIS